jgi:hypothetical protein
MTIRPYMDSDWEAVRDIYDLSKPDEMRGSVDPCFGPLAQPRSVRIARAQVETHRVLEQFLTGRRSRIVPRKHRIID